MNECIIKVKLDYKIPFCQEAVVCMVTAVAHNDSKIKKL